MTDHKVSYKMVILILTNIKIILFTTGTRQSINKLVD
jgi:hypothetical protein